MSSDILGHATMDITNIAKLDINLKKLSAVAVAVNLWELNEVKEKIRQFFNLSYPKSTIRKDWINSVIQDVAKKIDSLPIPCSDGSTRQYIRSYVYPVGGLIFDFIYYTHYGGSGLDFERDQNANRGFEVEFGLNISWGPYGRIEEAQMVRKLLRGSILEFALEDHFLSLANVYSDTDLVRPRMLFNDHRSMFLYCLEKDIFATRYFFTKLERREKLELAVQAAEKCFDNEGDDMYIRRRKTELLLFFMSEMSNIDRLEFVKEHRLTLFRTFLETWPHQELCLNILDSGNFTSTELSKYLGAVIQRLKCSYPAHKIPIMKDLDNNIFHVILRKLLKLTPDGVKQNYFAKSLELVRSCFYYFFVNKDYVTMSVILNDVSLGSIKHEVLFRSDFSYLYKHCTLRDCYEELTKYMDHVLASEEEKKIFKKSLIQFTNQLIRDGTIKAAAKLFDWICETNEEKEEMRSQIDPTNLRLFISLKRYDLAEELVKLLYVQEEDQKKAKRALFELETENPIDYCNSLVSAKCFRVANDYLKWRFESEQDRKYIKGMLYVSDEHFRDRCCELWSSFSKNEWWNTKRVCEELLNFFFEGREKDMRSFRKNIFYEKESFSKYFQHVCKRKWDSFLVFAGRNRAQIHEIKSDLSSRLQFLI